MAKEAEAKPVSWAHVLVILASVVFCVVILVPRIRHTSLNTKSGIQKENATTIRDAMTKYFYQHHRVYPGVAASHFSGTRSVPHADPSDAFLKQLTCYSDASGNTSDRQDERFPCDPILRQGIPANPLPYSGVTDAGASSVTVIETPLIEIDDESVLATGWVASNRTGEVLELSP